MNRERVKDESADVALNWCHNYSKDLILKIKEEQCAKCIYSVGSTKRNHRLEDISCNYLIMTGERRNCSLEHCSHFIERSNDGKTVGLGQSV